eukprot:CAMPEP_0115458988 /NCGR_PEP_ID=MMETSP0271-20121206/46016_1 /TAXON_ID=71861 /ORGANISM="Scrippsiella trochoidea, Strain CCMP3099" /LENGTH=60 /DNA_ID=CAMNT_0002885609 /DNA_START=344 /DNA_END=526 /DNA_ORIENTATION=-
MVSPSEISARPAALPPASFAAPTGAAQQHPAGRKQAASAVCPTCRLGGARECEAGGSSQT